MIRVLADHNVEGQAALLWEVLRAEGWLELFPLPLTTFAALGLRDDSSDRDVWQFAQEQQMILLTANCHMDDDDSLEQTIREANTPTSLPVLTIASPDRVGERAYRERRARRIMDIVLYLDNYVGTGRIFIP